MSKKDDVVKKICDQAEKSGMKAALDESQKMFSTANIKSLGEEVIKVGAAIGGLSQAFAVINNKSSSNANIVIAVSTVIGIASTMGYPYVSSFVEWGLGTANNEALRHTLITLALLLIIMYVLYSIL